MSTFQISKEGSPEQTANGLPQLAKQVGELTSYALCVASALSCVVAEPMINGINADSDLKKTLGIAGLALGAAGGQLSRAAAAMSSSGSSEVLEQIVTLEHKLRPLLPQPKEHE